MIEDIFKQDIQVPKVVEERVDDTLAMLDQIDSSESRDKSDTKVSYIKKNRIIRFAKRATAFVAGVALVVTTIYTADFFIQKSGSENLMNNCFSIRVMASELDEHNAAFLGGEDGVMLGSIGVSLDELDYLYALPINIVGENISKITYSIEGAQLQVISSKDDPFVLEGTLAEGDFEPFVFKDGYANRNGYILNDVDCSFYKSFTVDYDKQLGKDGEINFVNVFRGNQKVIDDFLDSTYLTEKEKCHYFNYLFKDILLTCTVAYLDGSSESLDLRIQADIYASEAADNPNIYYENVGLYLAIAGSEADINKEAVWEEVVGKNSYKKIDDSKYICQSLEREKLYEIDNNGHGFGYKAERDESQGDKTYILFDDREEIISAKSFATEAYFAKESDTEKYMILALEKNDRSNECRVYRINEDGLELTDEIDGTVVAFSFYDLMIEIGFYGDDGGIKESKSYTIDDGRLIICPD